MRKMLMLMLDYSDRAIQIPVFVFILVVVSYLIYRFIEKEGIVKFIPSIIVLITGFLILIFGIKDFLTHDGLKKIQLSIIAIGTGLIGLLFSWMLNINNKDKSINNRDVSNKNISNKG